MKAGDILLSHRGKGPEQAMVTGVYKTFVWLRHVGPRGWSFRLPRTYLDSPTCGWRKVK